MSRLRGKIKWYNNMKGVGVIEQDCGPDVHLHFTRFVDPTALGYIEEGDRVEFEINAGFGAENVVVLESANPEPEGCDEPLYADNSIEARLDRIERMVKRIVDARCWQPRDSIGRLGGGQ